MKRALVTGGGGFLGGAIVNLLHEQGIEVQVIGRSFYPWLQNLGIKSHQIDLAKATEITEIIGNVDLVFHVAAKAGIWGNYSEYFEANVVATRHLIDYCQSTQTPMVYTSSPSVIFNGLNMHRADESVPYPKSYHNYYSETKAIAEREVLQAANQNYIKACSLRPHLIWGPGDNHLIPRFLKRGAQGAIAVIGSGTNQVDTVYIEDAARAHLLAAQKLLQGDQISGQAFFISQDEPIALFEWINRFLEKAGIPPVRKKIPASIAYAVGGSMELLYKLFRIESEPRMTRFLALELSTEHTFDLTKAKRLLDYQPKFSMEEAFQKTFESEYFKNLINQL